MSEIGIDLDHSNYVAVRNTINKIRRYSPIFIRLFISPSGRGYHIRFATRREYNVRGLLRIRKELGDDPNRISMVDGRYRDVLFSIKIIDGKKYVSKEIDLDKFMKTGKRVILK